MLPAQTNQSGPASPTCTAIPTAHKSLWAGSLAGSGVFSWFTAEVYGLAKYLKVWLE
jgi:hypothetical protein